MIHALLEAEFSATDALYADDVFSAYTYQGNGGTQTITDGINRTKGFMQIIKQRNGATDWQLASSMGSALGSSRRLQLNLGNVPSSTYPYGLASWGNGTVTLKDDASGTYAINGPTSAAYCMWTFREALKFFVQQYVGSAPNTATLADLSALGNVGMAVVKRVNGGGDWWVWHRALAVSSPNAVPYMNDSRIPLNNGILTVAGTTLNIVGDIVPGYVVFAWAHDNSEDGLSQAVSFTGNQDVILGWEPQFLILKRTDAVEDWMFIDTSRGWTVDGACQILSSNSTAGEAALSGKSIKLTSSGFVTSGFTGNYIVLAIRRPNKPADKLGAAKVFAPVARTGTGAAASVTTPGFPADTLLQTARNADVGGPTSFITSRIRGGTTYLGTNSYSAETSAGTGVRYDVMNGYGFGGASLNNSAANWIEYALKRTPGFYDEVCYAGNGGTVPIAHNLRAVPTMAWVKNRTSGIYGFVVYHAALGGDKLLQLNANAAPLTTPGLWTFNSKSVFSTSNNGNTNASGSGYEALLFGDMPGVSKSGSFVLGASTVNLDLGFSARFFMCKRTDAAGDWYYWDSARGIVAANDSYLLLNTTAAEVTTTDHVDPIANGIAINPSLPAGSYIYYAIA